MTDTQQAQRRAPKTRQDERNRAILREHICGQSFEAIAERHDLSRQRVTEIVKREARAYLDQIEIDLMVAQKVGFGGPQFVVAFDRDGWQTPMCEFVWTLTRLRDERPHVPVRVRTQQTAEGTAFLLEQKETE